MNVALAALPTQGFTIRIHVPDCRGDYDSMDSRSRG